MGLITASTSPPFLALYRDAADPRFLTEVLLTASWEEDLNQHARIDDISARLIKRARSFDRRGEPTTVHLVAVDIEEPPDFWDLVVAHEEMPASDGSIPIHRPDREEGRSSRP